MCATYICFFINQRVNVIHDPSCVGVVDFFADSFIFYLGVDKRRRIKGGRQTTDGGAFYI